MQVSVIHNGSTLEQVNHDSTVYVVAPKSGDYTIRLYNDSGEKRLTVVSVDGINVVDGKDAGFSGPGYILNPWQTLDIPGWRRSDSEVAKFVFSKESDQNRKINFHLARGCSSTPRASAKALDAGSGARSYVARALPGAYDDDVTAIPYHRGSPF